MAKPKLQPEKVNRALVLTAILDGRRTILDIIAATGLPGAVVAHWLDQLEKDGRIERRPTGKVELNL